MLAMAALCSDAASQEHPAPPGCSAEWVSGDWRLGALLSLAAAVCSCCAGRLLSPSPGEAATARCCCRCCCCVQNKHPKDHLHGVQAGTFIHGIRHATRLGVFLSAVRWIHLTAGRLGHECFYFTMGALESAIVTLIVVIVGYAIKVSLVFNTQEHGRRATFTIHYQSTDSILFVFIITFICDFRKNNKNQSIIKHNVPSDMFNVWYGVWKQLKKIPFTRHMLIIKWSDMFLARKLVRMLCIISTGRKLAT